MGLKCISKANLKHGRRTWEMWYFEFTAQGIEFKENYMPKKYAVAILPLAGFLTTFGAAICFIKKV